MIHNIKRLAGSQVGSKMLLCYSDKLIRPHRQPLAGHLPPRSQLPLLFKRLIPPSYHYCCQHTQMNAAEDADTDLSDPLPAILFLLLLRNSSTIRLLPITCASETPPLMLRWCGDTPAILGSIPYRPPLRLGEPVLAFPNCRVTAAVNPGVDLADDPGPDLTGDSAVRCGASSSMTHSPDTFLPHEAWGVAQYRGESVALFLLTLGSDETARSTFPGEAAVLFSWPSLHS